MENILKIDYEKTVLDNGLEVILYPRKNVPLTAVNLWYKVGSANEVKGKTGLAHLFEHMMFQGSQNVPKEKHFFHLQEAGGTLNASTSFDRTNYYETVPSNYLDMALWLEADRMGYFLPALTVEKLENQREVVMNERRERYDNQPYGRAFELIFSNLFHEKHPYHWPTIGWMDDIKGYTMEDIQNFFRTYYSPGNASLVIAGDIDKNTALESVKKYFGDIPAVDNIPGVTFEKMPLDKNIDLIHKDSVQLPRIYLAWHSAEYFDEDDAPLDILSEYFTGSKSAAMNKKLVFEKQLALDVSAFQFSGQHDGMFIISATAKPGVLTDTLYDEIMKLIDDTADGKVEGKEITKAKNSVKSSYIYSLQNIAHMADHINTYNCNLGEPDSFTEDIRRYDKTGKEDVVKAASGYLKKPHVRLDIFPKNGEDV